MQSVAVMNYLRNSDAISKTLISGDDRLTNAEEDETTTVAAKVLNLKAILDSGHESEAVLFDSLSNLQRMVMSVNVLKLTRVGVSVNALRNHASKRVAEISRTLVKQWKAMVDEWLNNNNNNNNENNVQQQIKGTAGESIQNPPYETEKPRSLIIRIKLKKDYPKSPATPDQKVEEALKPVLDAPDQTLKKVEKITSSMETLNETGIGTSVTRVPDKKLVSQEFTWLKTARRKTESGLNTGRKINEVHSRYLKKRLICDADDGAEEKFKTAATNFRKSYLDDENMKKKRRIQLLSYDEQISLAVSRQELKPPLKRQFRRRW